MKVTAFVASPRKHGNTDLLAQHFLDGARSTGAETQKVYLYDHTVEFCQGCYKNCWTTAGDCLRFEDDMQGLFETLLSSDLVLVASPVYMGNFSSKLAAFFERSIPARHVDLQAKVVLENRLAGKRAVMALVHDSPDPATADLPFQVLEHVLGKSSQMQIAGRLQVGGVRDPGDIRRKERCLQEAYQLGAKLCGP